MPQRHGPQVDLRHVRRLHARRVQRQRKREEDHPERHHKPRLTYKGRHWSEEGSREGIPPLPRPLAERSRPAVARRRLRPRAHDSTGSRQNVAHQIRRRLGRLQCQCPQPLLPRLHVRQQRTANRTDAPMGFEALLASRTQPAFQGVADERFELGALDLGSPTGPVLAGRGGGPVFGFLWHHITCLYVRCRSRASSARPRLILDLTVPSGTLKAVAISR